MTPRTVEKRVLVQSHVEHVWAQVVTQSGFNHEMRPWVTMRMPRAARGLTVETVPLGRPVGRAWLRLLGVIPFDYDRLVIVELEPGRRFLERSTMLSMRQWEHERILTPTAGGTEVHDRIAFEPRLALRPLSRLLARGVDTFFQHRQRRHRQHFSS